MYLNTFLSSLHKHSSLTRCLLFVKLKEAPKNCYSKNDSLWKRYASDIRMPVDRLNSLSKDVLLFSYEKAKFLKYLGIFGIFQMCLWSFWGTDMYKNLRNIENVEPSGKSKEYLDKHPVLGRINLGDQKYRLIALNSCLTIGAGTLVILLMLPSRIVRYLVLCKGGQNARIVTYGAFGRTRELLVPLHKLSCQLTRESAKSYVPLKIKGRFFFYLLDCRGSFTNPQLFDYTIGTKTFKTTQRYK